MPIDPDLAARLHLIDGIPSFEAAFADPKLLARLQAFDASFETPPSPPVEVRDDEAPGPHGPVRVRISTPAGRAASGAALVWMHGGGFQGGSLDMPEGDWTARGVADRSPATVISVDYRLAVDGVTYPVPHDDAVAAIRWARDSASSFGIDPARISVGGGSAGANLAAGAVLRLRDDDAWSPASLILVYPTMHAELPPPSATLADLLAEVPPLFRINAEGVRGMNANYLGGPMNRADGYAMPGGAVLEGLCPTLVINAEYDDLRSSGEAFAASLALASVDVRQVLVRTMLHGFLNQPALAPTDRILDLMAAVVAGR